MSKNPRRLPCMCGHAFETHGETWGCVVSLDGQYEYGYSLTCTCKKFKLDNLKFIEWLTKKKNLI
jgi:hypothetical protein